MLSLPKQLALVLAALFFMASTALAAPVAGDMAPDIFGKNLKGESPKLADFQGKVVVLTFWATWCPYCLKELPILEGIQRAGKTNVQVVAVNRESRDVFRAVERHLNTLTMLLTYDPGNEGAKAYGVSGIPHLVIIGRDGKIVSVHRGYGESSLPEILDAINLAIATPAPDEH
ncbi:MAG: TlpA family protein disulfide reductase [Massilia sp.]